MTCFSIIFFFFFQAEDGIRDYKVTGVQTCALPICGGQAQVPRSARAVRPCAAGAGLCRKTRRSEEHTSELQSPCNLVCRLLLEKKKHTVCITSDKKMTLHRGDYSIVNPDGIMLDTRGAH